MDYNKFSINKFNLDQMVQNPSILIIARRSSGKSFIVREILNHYKNIPAGLVISPTDRMNSFYKHLFPDLYIHYDTKDITLKKILLRQAMMIDRAKNSENEIDPSAVTVMDDNLPKKKSWTKDENIMEILMNGRHYQLTTMVTMQTPLGITPDMRANFDYIFLLRDDSMINKKKLWNNYAGMFPTFDSFEKVFDECTKDYRAMVIDNRNPCDNIQEKVFWFKAKECSFMFGSKEFQDFHTKYYDPLWNKKSLDTDYLYDYFTNENKECPDTDYMVDYFANEDKLIRTRCKKNTTNTKINKNKFKKYETSTSEYNTSIWDNGKIETDCDTKINHQNQPNNNEIIQLAYDDPTYKLQVRVTNLNNHKLIETLCNHIVSLKSIKN